MLREDLTNAEAFQLIACKFGRRLGRKQEIDLKEFEVKTSANQGKRILLTFNLNTRYNILTDIQTDFEKKLRNIDFGDIAIV